ncbi:MAG: histidine phosphatase family protein [Victivallales bacterium]|nr:histidine phosphatase family protein [Victivallales bacterium]
MLKAIEINLKVIAGAFTMFRRCLCLFLVCMGVMGLSEDAFRTIYITRHAQRGPRKLWPEADRGTRVLGEVVDGVYEPTTEDTITPLGEKQCQKLGKYLESKGFHGKVYASPRFWTMETAVGIVNAISPDLKIVPVPNLQSQAVRLVPADSYISTELERRFPGRVIHVDYPRKWLLSGEIDRSKMIARMEKVLAELLSKDKGDMLIVGHSSSIPGLLHALNARRIADVPELTTEGLLNCCLYVCKLNERDEVISASWTIDFLPKEMQTSNFVKLVSN